MKKELRESMAIKDKIINTIEEEGFWAIPGKAKNYLTFRIEQKIKRNSKKKSLSDILFISGCNLPHPQRYRVEHQMEQLAAFGVSSDMVPYTELTIDMIKYHRGFVFYRCPFIPVIDDFIKIAKENNKTIFYDIDDLVFDTKYTDKIPYIDEMNRNDREVYDDGVRRMGKTMQLCEYGITTTDRLANEMKKTLGEVYINRNVASEEMVKYSNMALEEKKENKKIIIGYFSGSLTHNSDFEMIMPVVKEILEKYDNLYLKIVGELKIPEELESVKEKILTSPFVDWRELPKLIHSVDINIAPIEHTVFNEAKSENKWTEAALVKVPTVASDWGAFKEAIRNGETGILCKNNKEWKESLIHLIENGNERERIANAAYKEVISNHITIKTGKGIADFIQSKLKRNAAFVLPSVNVSGGIMVAMKHAEVLKKNGYDVLLLNACSEESNVRTDNGTELFVVPANRSNVINLSMDNVIATMWTTLNYVKQFGNCKNKKYLVQNFETDFYKYGKKERKDANATYMQNDVEYITISKWCKNWLEKDFGQKVKFAPNGIDIDYFEFRKRDFGKGKIKILVEGNSKDYYKNVDESFKIVEKLDKNKFEIIYLSYNGEPKSWYRVDKFYHKVPHSEVGKIYGECDILLKTSILESFSYPPLEMMATGGYVVAVPNEGNREYLKDGENCLFYKQGDIDEAVEKIEKIVKDEKLREKLAKNGRKTAEERDWKKVEKEILKLYE